MPLSVNVWTIHLGRTWALYVNLCHSKTEESICEFVVIALQVLMEYIFGST